MFIVYSDMFRLTRVILRLELYLVCNVTVLILGSQTFWDPRIDIANKYSSSLRMTRVSRNVSL